MTITDSGNGRAVSKNWLIGVLVGLIAALSGLGINQHLNQANAAIQQLQSQEVRITRLEEKYDKILEGITTIRQDMKELKK